LITLDFGGRDYRRFGGLSAICARSDCSRFGGRGFDGWILLKNCARVFSLIFVFFHSRARRIAVEEAEVHGTMALDYLMNA